MKKVQVGDPAPDFTWAARSGEQVRLSEVRNEQVVVLFFYPRDGSVIRTKYVIDKAGIVRLVFSAPMMADRHVTEALRVVGGTGSRDYGLSHNRKPRCGATLPTNSDGYVDGKEMR